MDQVADLELDLVTVSVELPMVGQQAIVEMIGAMALIVTLTCVPETAKTMVKMVAFANKTSVIVSSKRSRQSMVQENQSHLKILLLLDN